MRTILIIVVLILGLSNCFAQSDSLPISVTIKVDTEYVKTYAKYKSIYATEIRQKLYHVKSDSIKEKFYEISLAIKNTSGKVIKIWLMSCSWDENFIVNNNYISLRGHDCNKNFPDLIEFKPGESKTLTGTLTKSIKFDYPCENCLYGKQVETTKLGLIIIDDIFNSSLDMPDYNIAMEDKSKWTVVWSNALYLLKESEANPEPLRINIYENRRRVVE